MDIRPILKSQYHAALAMLGDAVRACPDDLWTDAAYPNRFWPLNNIRHIQHHAAQLSDRLRTKGAVGVEWVGGRASG